MAKNWNLIMLISIVKQPTHFNYSKNCPRNSIQLDSDFVWPPNVKQLHFVPTDEGFIFTTRKLTHIQYAHDGFPMAR